MADDDALEDDPETGADDHPCRTSNLQAFLERYGMLAIIVYGCISLGVFCAIYAALVFGADAGPGPALLWLLGGGLQGHDLCSGDRPHKAPRPHKTPDRGLHRRAHLEERERRRRRDDAELRGLLDDDDELTRGAGSSEELGEDELEKEEARAAAAAPAVHVSIAVQLAKVCA